MGAHSALTGADLHEPKGADTAASLSIFIADGAGSGAWQVLHARDAKMNAEGSAAFTGPTAYTAISSAVSSNGSATTAGDITESNFKLTYTGTRTHVFRIFAQLGLSQDDATARDVSVTIAKNGVADATFTQVKTLAQNIRESFALSGLLSLAEDDYIEIMAKSPAGNVTVYTPYVYIDAFPG